MFLYEAVVSRSQAGEFDTFSIADIDKAFKDNDRFQQLRFKQVGLNLHSKRLFLWRMLVMFV